MKKTMSRISLVLFFVSLFCSCTSTAQQTQEFKLPSGRIVKVLGVGRINFSQGPPALMLKYETDLKITEAAKLRKEVDEIWAVFKADVENGQFRSAIVSANEKPTGFIVQRSNSYNFVFEKRADGHWHCLEDDKGKSK